MRRLCSLALAAALAVSGCGGCGSGTQAAEEDAAVEHPAPDAGPNRDASEGEVDASMPGDAGTDAASFACSSDPAPPVLVKVGLHSDVNCWGFSFDGDYVVYSDKRFGDPAVFLWDLRCNQEFQLSEPGVYAWFPSISGTRVMWIEKFDVMTGIPSMVVELDLESGVRTDYPPREFVQGPPFFSAEYVVLDSSRLSPDGSVWGLDLWRPSTDEWTLLSAWQWGPETYDFDGRYVSWAAFPDDSGAWEKDIYVHDVETGETRRIVKDPGMQGLTSVDQGRVVWDDERNGNRDIRMYDLATNTETCLACGPQDETNPTISGNLVVWSDCRWSDYAPKCGADNDLYIYDLDTQVGRRVTFEPGSYGSNKIKGGRLAYVKADFDSNPSLVGTEGFVLDLVRAGYLDAGGHVIPE